MLRTTAVPSRMLLLLVLLSASLPIASCGSDDDPQLVQQPPTVSVPTVVGVNSTRPGGTLTLCAVDGGQGEGLEYQFDFRVGQDGGLLDWSSDSCRTHSYAFEGRYTARTRARRGETVSEWSDDWIITVIDETVTAPNVPDGDSLAVIGEGLRVCTKGSVSSLEHNILYRFRIDPDKDFDWHIDKCSTLQSTSVGSFRLRAQARCLVHDGITSDWSRSKEVIITSAADTRIVRAYTTRELASGPSTEINLWDTVSDTIPLRSWLTLVVEGSTRDFSGATCEDPVNRCIGFQMQYMREDKSVSNGVFTSSWLPREDFDSNPDGVRDTLRMQVGSAAYSIRARAVDELAPDIEPAVLNVTSNFVPILDDYFLLGHDGAVVRHGDTLFLDWWAPANDDTVDTISATRTKRFYFVVRAEGHDDPRDGPDSAIKSWRYFFYAVDGPPIHYDLARAGQWVEGLQADALSDTVEWVVTYPIDDLGGDVVFDNLPPWINSRTDFALRGRDSGVGDVLRESVYLDGEASLVSEYSMWEYGRRTEAGFQRFYVLLVR